MTQQNLSRREFAGALAIAGSTLASAAADGWIELFDGRSLNGWTPSENKGSWKVVDGCLTANGPRSHLFYSGKIHQADFKNFELEVEVVTKPECNSGVYFHTVYQETGFPDKGFEIQINNTAKGDGGYLERKKTGSLYGIRNMYKQLVQDEKPFRLHVAVLGKNVQIRLNGRLLVDYLEPTPPVIPAGGEKGRFLDHGTFALQCHNDGSRASYRSVRVRPLADSLPAYTGVAPEADTVFRQIIDIGRHNIPMVDYDVYLRPGMTIEQCLRKSRADGIQQGIVFPSSELPGEDVLSGRVGSLRSQPIFCGLLADQHGWSKRLSRRTAEQFDYVLLDSRTWLAKDAPSASSSGEAFLDAHLRHSIEQLDSEPIDIYTHVTALPKALRSRAEQLWTEARMDHLIEALVRNKVAVEINSLDKLPQPHFLSRAKAAGCKFAFGTANTKFSDLGRCEYGLQMVEEGSLQWQNFYAPGSWYPKAVARRSELLAS